MRLKKLVSIGLVFAVSTSYVISGNAASDGRASSGRLIIQSEHETNAEEALRSSPDSSAAETGGRESPTKTVSAKEKVTEEILPGDISVTWANSRVYTDLTLGRYKTITTYGVKGYEDVPFISAHDYLDILCEGKEKITVEDGVMKIAVNGTEALIDPEKDRIRLDDPARFRSEGDVDGGIVSWEEFNVITPSVKHRSTQDKAKPVDISMKEYYMPVIAYEDTILMPFLALQNTFGSIRMSNVLAYNGRDYYNVFAAGDFAMQDGNEAARESPYIEAIYNGPFSGLEKTTQAYADYGYYSVCLLLDLTFGHKEEKNITSFDEYFTRMNARQSMCSTNPSSAMLSEFMLFNYLFGSGHDSLINNRHVFAADLEADPADVSDLADDIKRSEEGRTLLEEQKKKAEEKSAEDEATGNAILGALMEKGWRIPEIVPLLAWTVGINQSRPEDYGDRRLDYAGDTAVIYFSSFDDDTTERDPSYYLDPIKEEDEEKSTFAFFYRCFEDIQKHKRVKNVVINIADNGGGAATALVSVLGFLSKDGEVKITVRDMLAESYREEYYHVDTNLDGAADDADGFGGQYAFYILCSGSSYSCGNALPYFAQKEGLATIIGSAPGGGDCVVATFTDAYGRCACYSGMLKLGTMEGSRFVSDEEATVPDLNMMPSVFDVFTVPWFDVQGIADAVHRYQKGESEIRYTEEESGKSLSEALGKLFGKPGQSEDAKN
ncbi:MAG: hypothetical protein IJU30_01975 [Lachnospiraceae bacterium]|nr:hypothetical protein [Lachnospiraceae bacterium]